MEFDKKQNQLNFFIKLDEKIANLSSKDKVAFIDNLIKNGNSININFPFSHSGRLINRRIYSKKGQKQVIHDLVNPTPAPITLDHEDKTSNIIGRIVKADYVDTFAEAKAFFDNKKINPAYLNDIEDGLKKLDYEKLSNAYHKSKVLMFRDWKGTGFIKTLGRISDPDAIVKFIDQRYLNLSAEQNSDVHVCSICLLDWKKDGLCEHLPGRVYDGKMAFSLCGNMTGYGTSVVVNGADPDSFVNEITLNDSEGNSLEEISVRLLDNLIVDSSIYVEENNKMNLIESYLKGEELTKDQLFDLFLEVSGETLNRSEFDGLSDSIKVNGLPVLSVKIKEKLESLELEDSLKAEGSVFSNLMAKIQLFEDESAEELKDTKINPETIVDFLTVESLKDENNVVLLDRVKEIVNQLNLIPDSVSTELEEVKNKLQQLENAKVDLEKDSVLLREKEKNRIIMIDYRNLLRDHVNLVKNFDSQKEKLDNLLEKSIPIFSTIFSDKDFSEINFEKVIEIVDSFDKDTLESKLNDGLANKKIEPIELEDNINNTSIESLTSYEKKVLSNFKSILDSDGEQAAKAYFKKVKIYCSKDFDPNKFSE